MLYRAVDNVVERVLWSAIANCHQQQYIIGRKSSAYIMAKDRTFLLFLLDLHAWLLPLHQPPVFVNATPGLGIEMVTRRHQQGRSWPKSGLTFHVVEIPLCTGRSDIFLYCKIRESMFDQVAIVNGLREVHPRHGEFEVWFDGVWN